MGRWPLPHAAIIATLCTAPAIQAQDAPPAVQTRTAKGSFDAGMELLKQRDYTRALAAFEAAEKMDPTFAKAVYRQGYCLRKLKRYPDAVAAYTRFRGLAPNDPDGAYGLAESHRLAGDERGALQAFSDYVALEKRPSEAKWVKKAQARIDALREKLGPADVVTASPAPEPPAPELPAAEATPAAQAENGAFQARMAEGEKAYGEGQYEAAATAFQAALALSPAHPEALFRLAGAHIGRGDLAAARAQYEAYTKVAADDPNGHFALAETCRRQPDALCAAGAYQAFLTAEPTPGRVKRRERAEKYLAAHPAASPSEPAVAAVATEPAADAAPETIAEAPAADVASGAGAPTEEPAEPAPVVDARAVAAVSARDDAAWLAYAADPAALDEIPAAPARAHGLAPHNPAAKAAHVAALSDAGYLNEARALSEDVAVHRAPTAADRAAAKADTEKAVRLLSVGNADAAKAALARAFALDPEEGTRWSLRADWALRANQSRQAAVAARRALSALRPDPRGWLWLARALDSAGDVHGAQLAYARFVRTCADDPDAHDARVRLAALQNGAQ